MPKHERQGKWQPFDGLQGYRAALRKTEKNRTAVACPTLSEDAIQEIDQCLQQALQKQARLKVTYYKSGFFYDAEGVIVKINRGLFELVIGEQTIGLTSIYRVEKLSGSGIEVK